MKKKWEKGRFINLASVFNKIKTFWKSLSSKVFSKRPSQSAATNKPPRPVKATRVSKPVSGASNNRKSLLTG